MEIDRGTLKDICAKLLLAENEELRAYLELYDTFSESTQAGIRDRLKALR